MNFNTTLYALGAILLGAVGVCFHDFALQWQPLPAGIASALTGAAWLIRKYAP